MTEFGRRVTKDDLLALWRRDMDVEYTLPLEDENDGRGLDIISGLASIFERVSSAVQVSTQAFYLKEHALQIDPPASGAVRATGTIDIYRRTLTGGDINLLVGDVLVIRVRNTEGEWINGVELRLTASVTIPPATVGPTPVAVEAVRVGFQGNVPAGRVAVFVERGRATVPLLGAGFGVVGDTAEYGNTPDLFTEDMVGRYFRFTDATNASLPAYRIVTFTPAIAPGVQPNLITLDRLDYDEPSVSGNGLVIEIADLGIDALLNTATTGGRHGELDMIAFERGQGRASGESDASLRGRIGDLFDTVSPDAIVRAVTGILDPLGVSFTLVEIGTTEGRGFAIGVDALTDPTAFAHGRFLYGPTTSKAWSVLGFLLVIDGSALPLDEAPVLNAIINLVNAIKAAGVPWAMAFEPPIP